MTSNIQNVTTGSARETRALGLALAPKLRGGDLVLMIGDLGAGKSEFARGIAEGLGATEWRGSPTYNLVHEYPTVPALYHVDLYRLSSLEVEDLGLEEYLREDAVLIVEWADRAPHLAGWLPGRRILQVQMEHRGSDRRLITLSPFHVESSSC